jgi:hypothetical protein
LIKFLVSAMSPYFAVAARLCVQKHGGALSIYAVGNKDAHKEGGLPGI